jgi:Na+-driven multidrug efflux pump
VALGVVLSSTIYLLARPLLSLYDADPQVIDAGVVRLTFVLIPYFICGLMETIVGVLRGFGRSILPMIVSLIGSCVFRIVWIYTVFAAYQEFWVIFISYPISWAITTATHFVCFRIIFKKEKQKLLAESIG